MNSDNHNHLAALRRALEAFEDDIERIECWGHDLGRRLEAGGRLLTVGNGGSAAHAEHLAAELVGRYRENRPPFSALSLHVGGATLTALTNDYGPEQMFARQVLAHARPDDVLIAFSTSGCSPNVVAPAHAAKGVGAAVWSFTGPTPNPLADASAEVVAVDSERAATVQEVHQVALHLLCAAFDRSRTLPPGPAAPGCDHEAARPHGPGPCFGARLRVLAAYNDSVNRLTTVPRCVGGGRAISLRAKLAQQLRKRGGARRRWTTSGG